MHAVWAPCGHLPVFVADGLTAEVVDGASLCMSLRSFVEPFGSFGEHGFLGLPCSSEQDFCKLPLQPLYLRRGVPVHRSYDTQNPVLSVHPQANAQVANTRSYNATCRRT